MQFSVPATCLAHTKVFRYITTAFTTSIPATITASSSSSSSSSRWEGGGSSNNTTN